jgi:two-component system chemotaxis response regulator CheY
MATPDPQSDARNFLRRLTEMSVKARLMDGGRCVLASMRLQPISFDTPSGPTSIDQVIFSSVGRDRIKCLKPRALFQLPMIRIADCRDSISIEARIRLAWRKHIEELAEASKWLRGIGTDVMELEERSLIGFRIEGEPDMRITLLDRRHMILPSHGRLSGISLQRAEDRSIPIDRMARTSAELGISVSTRIEELVRMDRRLREDERRAAMNTDPDRSSESMPARQIRLLLVGPRLAREQHCIESLRMRHYKVDTALDERDGLAVFDHSSPELVLADMKMNRDEGTSFVLALRRVTGIEEIPVVLVDETRRDSRRDSARQVGAAGYLVYPIDVQRITARLNELVTEPRRRRYTRYSRRLPVQLSGSTEPCIVTSLGRGGMFVATDDSIETHTLRECRLSLPELDDQVTCETEVIYQRERVGTARGGVGVRFHSFAGGDEYLLLDYLRTINPSVSAAT